MEISLSIGEKIKALRTQAGMTQEELAQRLSVSYQAIQKYEKGIVHNLPLYRVAQIAQVFNVSPGYLMGWEEKEPDADLAGLKRDEQNLVMLFRKVPEKDKALVLSLIRAALNNQ